MEIKRAMIRPWQLGSFERQLWSEHARRGSLVIHTSKEATHAVVVDDYEGVRTAFKVAPDQVDEVIGAAAKAWVERKSGGSFAVFFQGLKDRGEIIGPPPPPPPPGGHERIFMKQVAAAHAVFDAATELVELSAQGEIKLNG